MCLKHYFTVNKTESFDVRCRPSLGIFSRCKKINGIQHCGSFAVEGLATDSDMFPIPWKIAIVLMFSGILISIIMSIMAVCSFCKQSIRRKSIFGLAGSGQGLSGKQFNFWKNAIFLHVLIVYKCSF